VLRVMRFGGFHADEVIIKFRLELRTEGLHLEIITSDHSWYALMTEKIIMRIGTIAFSAEAIHVDMVGLHAVEHLTPRSSGDILLGGYRGVRGDCLMNALMVQPREPCLDVTTQVPAGL
jgi:hypothetical protein